jgi:TolB-like protein/Flp pilus assembly protein TadD
MWELRLLGASDLKGLQEGEQKAVHLPPKRFALLVFLALASSRGRCQRDSLLPLFWPNADERRARNALSQSLHQLRHEMGQGTILSLGADQIAVPSDQVWCDAVAFERACLAGRHEDALDLYRGELLPGFHVGGALELGYWLDDERERLRRLASGAARLLADEAERRGDSAQASRWLERLLRFAPADENVLCRLMQVLEGTGDRAGALRAFKRYDEYLRQELDMEPSHETRALAERIRQGHGSGTVGEPGAAPGTSIAVLPFTNFSGDPDQAYFCDGMTEAITSALSRMEGFDVAARSSAFAFRDRTGDLAEIGRKLRVGHVLEGSVRRAGSRVRVTAQLIRLPDGFHVSSWEYDGDAGDVLGVQTDVARRVALELRGAVAVPPAPAGLPTRDPEAYDRYLRGRFLLRKRNPRDLERAVSLLAEAVRHDPGFAAAHSALGEAHAVQGAIFQDLLPSRVCMPRAMAALERALELDEGQAESHAALGVCRAVYEWDWAQGVELTSRACELAPSSGFAHLARATVLTYGGRLEEALEAATRAVRLEPFALSFRETLGICLYLQRRYGEALASLQGTLEMEPGLYIARVVLADTLAALGRSQEALEIYETVMESMERPSPYALSGLGRLHATLGREKEAGAVLDQMAALSRDVYVRPTYAAYVHAALGDGEGALDCLEGGLRERDLHVSCINVDPRFDTLRPHSRYRSFLDTVGSLA